MAARGMMGLLLVALAAGAAACQVMRAPVWIVNVMVLTGFAIAALWSRRKAAPWGGPLTVKQLTAPHWAWTAAAAVAAAYPTLGLVYYCDDICLLVERGERGFIEALTPTPNDPFFRPTGWALWWFFGKAFRDEPASAHAFALGLFVVNALLVAPALRRCGAPRNVAGWAGILFALHPAVLDTVAWLSNVFSFLGLGFSLAALASLPPRRPTLTTMALPTALAGLAFLSKEDTFLLPVAVVAAGARFRRRELGPWVVGVLPMLTVLAAIIGARFGLMGRFGGYRDAQTGKALAADRAWTGPWEALLTEAPSRYALPFRFDWMWSSWNRIAALTFPCLLAFGAGSAVVKRAVRRGLFFAFLTWAPAGSILPMGRQLENSRALYCAAAYLAWIVAALIGTAPWPRWIRYAALAALAAASLAAGRVNLSAWEGGARQMLQVKEAVVPRIVETQRQGFTRVLVLGLPDNVNGAVCFRNAGPVFLERLAGRENLKIETPLEDEGRFARVLWYDPKRGTCQDFFESWQPQAALDGDSFGAERELRVDLREGRRAAEGVRLFSATASPGPGDAWTVWPATSGATVFLAPVKVNYVKALQVELDGECLLASGSPSECSVIWTQARDGVLLRRKAPIPATIEIFPETRVVSLEIRIPFGSRLVVREIRIRPL